MTDIGGAVQRLRSLVGRGEFLLAYDEAVAALDGVDGGEDALELQYLAVLALARSGATHRAMEQFRRFGLDRAEARGATGTTAEDIAALEARVAKDRALASNGEIRRRRARDAAIAYETIFDHIGGSYTCINAATMWLLAGDAERSRRLAAIARDLSSRPGAAGARYWQAATAAEAALLLDDLDAARVALAIADEESVGQYATRATTRKQLGLICGLGAHDRSILSILANPGVIHYAGHRITASGDGRFTPAGEAHVRAAIDGALDAHHIGFGFGSLASGADILFAEALLARHAELHVVMPFGVDAFIEASVIDSGPVWVDRFHRCFAQAKTVVYASDGDYLGDAVMFDFCARVAMGEALGRAAALDAEVRQIVVWDGEVSDNVAGTAVDIATWRRTGRAATVISPRPDGGGPPFHDVEAPATSIAADDGADGEASPRAQASLSKERVTRAMLFADIAGFSKLTDRQIPTFIEQVMWPLARAIDAHGDGALLRQTWGDGLYLVFPSVSAAARCALALQATMRGIDLVGVGLSELRGMRIGVHVGPVYEGWDEVRKEINFFGANVTRAARIEPRTPEGEVYVTHPFASLIALEGEGHWTCQYVGHVPAAKDYGVLPMYVLKEPAMGRTD